MRVGLLGRKVGMTQIFEANGTAVPVTVLECGPCTVLQVRTAERDGYHALQLGFDDKKRKSATQAERGHARKVDAEPKRYVREIRQDAAADGVAQGQTLTVEVFNEIPRVDVIGTSKGRGYSGVVKRHGFKGLRATHGVKRMHRHPGSSGPSADPAHTRKGIRKPGQYGNARITVKNLKVVRVDPTNNLLLIRGAVPGPNGGFLTVRQTNKVYHDAAGGPNHRPSNPNGRIMLTVPVSNPAGEKVGEESIDPADFGGAVNKQLLHDVVLMHLAARRVGTVNTRGRADVAGSGKKLFRQKGTGNARAGSKRTNKRGGGGVAFARRNRDYRYSIPKKAVRAAIRMALLSKFQDGQAVVIDGLAPGEKPKTKLVVQALRSIRRPDLKESEAIVVDGETKVAALRRTLEG